MDETTIAVEDATQQQLAELQAKVEGLRVSSAKEDGTLADSVTPIDLEKTPDFEAWKQARLQECLNYLRTNWKMDVTAEKLVMKEMYAFPDPDNRRAYASVDNFNYIDPATSTVAISLTTGQRMSYTVWRKIDPPVIPAPEPVEPTI